MSGVIPKADLPEAMSAFTEFTSEVGAEADMEMPLPDFSF
jgi:hypothetical protein